MRVDVGYFHDPPRQPDMPIREDPEDNAFDEVRELTDRVNEASEGDAVYWALQAGQLA
ncbi:MAG: hypothetical protein GF320_14355, partial [Armatimonadia bacterium]|nr:hypothetical protein [Armatimonadia bacterium]